MHLDDLRRFLEHPARSFLRQRLNVTHFSDDADPADALPVELDGLESWAVGERLLRARLGGRSARDCQEAEWRRGSVPPGELGKQLLVTLSNEIEPLAEAGGRLLAGDPVSADVQVRLPGGQVVTGVVPGVRGDVIASVEYSKLGPKHRLRAWLYLLALTAHCPDRPWQAVTIGRGRSTRPSRSTLGPVPPDTALTVLADLAALAGEGRCQPLPIAATSSHAYAEARVRGADHDAAFAKACAEWSRFGGGAECEDPEHEQVWGPAAPLDALGPQRFADLALRLWSPLFRAELVDTS